MNNDLTNKKLRSLIESLQAETLESIHLNTWPQMKIILRFYETTFIR